MGIFEYEWWTVDVILATGRISFETKAKDKDHAVKQILRMAKGHDKEVQAVRPEFKTKILWETLSLDRKGYQRRF